MIQQRTRPQASRRMLLYSTVGALIIFFSLCQLVPYRQFEEQQIFKYEVEIVHRKGNRTEMDKFWKLFESHLTKARPNCPSIKADRRCKIDAHFRPTAWKERYLSTGACNLRDMSFRPGQHERPRADRIRLDAQSFDCLESSHDLMNGVVDDLANELPYKSDTSGIVMLGGSTYDFLTLVSLRMLRLSGSSLPVEVFLVSDDEYDAHTCEVLYPSLNARCRLLSDTLSFKPRIRTISRSPYQYKALAILFSSFENALFIDADAFVVLPPDDIFISEPFNSTGLVLWPDLWAESSSPIFFRIAGLPVPPVQRYSSDSGVILYSKRKHASSLLLATYYNYYGPDYYYPLLSQGAHGQGDKETYLHAARALGMDFWDVKTPLWEIGRWLDYSTFQRVGMGQHHPQDDFELSSEDIYRKNKKVRPFVLHINNPWKLLPDLMFSNKKAPTSYKGKQIRVLGTKEDMVETFGYDLEATMWQQVKHVACDLQIGCKKVEAYYKNVFGIHTHTHTSSLSI